MLPEKGRKVGIGNQVSSNSQVPADLMIEIKEIISFRYGSNARQFKERFDIAKRFSR